MFSDRAPPAGCEAAVVRSPRSNSVKRCPVQIRQFAGLLLEFSSNQDFRTSWANPLVVQCAVSDGEHLTGRKRHRIIALLNNERARQHKALDREVMPMPTMTGSGSVLFDFNFGIA